MKSEENGRKLHIIFANAERLIKTTIFVLYISVYLT